MRIGAKELVDLLTGYHYVNIHSQANAPGELRGQVGGPAIFQASLSGANETPPVASTASGMGVVAMNAQNR